MMNGAMPITDIFSTHFLFVLLFSDSPYADRISLEELISYGSVAAMLKTPPRWPRLVFKIFMTSLDLESYYHAGDWGRGSFLSPVSDQRTRYDGNVEDKFCVWTEFLEVAFS